MRLIETTRSLNHPWGGWAEPGAGRSNACPEARAAGARAKTCRGSRLRPELVVEVAYEHMQGSRFRHMAQFRRWRFDKPPRDCTYAQLEVVPPQELMDDLRQRPLIEARRVPHASPHLPLACRGAYVGRKRYVSNAFAIGLGRFPD